MYLLLLFCGLVISTHRADAAQDAAVHQASLKEKLLLAISENVYVVVTEQTAIRDRASSGVVSAPAACTGTLQLFANQSNVLVPGEFCLGPHPTDGSFLLFQADGNLVSYTANGEVVWNSITAGKGVTSMVLQDDGNLVLLGPESSPTTIIFTTNTAGTKNATLKLYVNGASAIYDGLTKVHAWVVCIPSPNTITSPATYARGSLCLGPVEDGSHLFFGGDGSLAVYGQNNLVTWSLRNMLASSIAMQSDGNLVMYSLTGLPVWSTQTDMMSSSPPFTLSLVAGWQLLIKDNDGNILFNHAGPCTSPVALPLRSGQSFSPGKLCVGPISDGTYAAYRSDGNFVVMNKFGFQNYSTHSSGAAGNLVVQDDGNVVIYDNNVPTWSTETSDLQTAVEFDLVPGWELILRRQSDRRAMWAFGGPCTGGVVPVTPLPFLPTASVTKFLPGTFCAGPVADGTYVWYNSNGDLAAYSSKNSRWALRASYESDDLSKLEFGYVSGDKLGVYGNGIYLWPGTLSSSFNLIPGWTVVMSQESYPGPCTNPNLPIESSNRAYLPGQFCMGPTPEGYYAVYRLDGSFCINTFDLKQTCVSTVPGPGQKLVFQMDGNMVFYGTRNGVYGPHSVSAGASAEGIGPAESTAGLGSGYYYLVSGNKALMYPKKTPSNVFPWAFIFVPKNGNEAHQVLTPPEKELVAGPVIKWVLKHLMKAITLITPEEAVVMKTIESTVTHLATAYSAIKPTIVGFENA